MENRPKTEVVCETCNTPFLKENRQINRTVKNKGVHCCSRSCTNKYLSDKKVKPMSYNLRNAKRLSKQKGLDCTLTLEYLQDMFDKQKGLCAISGVPIEVVWKNNVKKLNQVSIDRLDNNLGYIIGNVHLVALGINYLRNTFELEDTKQFLDLLKE